MSINKDALLRELVAKTHFEISRLLQLIAVIYNNYRTTILFSETYNNMAGKEC
jgi:hypothetical protein